MQHAMEQVISDAAAGDVTPMGKELIEFAHSLPTATEDEVDKLLEDDEDKDENDSEDDGDFSLLDEILSKAAVASAEERKLKSLRKRLAKVSRSSHESAESERVQLLADIRRLEEGRIWLTVGSAALFHHQKCLACGSDHFYFMGWYTEQKHAHDHHARRLVAGKAVEQLPERKEVHEQPPVELCYNCVECIIAVDISTGEASE